MLQLHHVLPSHLSSQIGLYGQEFSEDSAPLSFLSAYPVEAGLVDVEEGAGQEDPGERLTLADTIAPHWFSPPEGTFVSIPTHVHVCINGTTKIVCV